VAPRIMVRQNISFHSDLIKPLNGQNKAI
jgi:hypothetical protein